MVLYSWKGDRRASRGAIRHAILYAMAEKAMAATKPEKLADWPASTMSRDWIRDIRAQSVHTRARRHLEYWRMRAFMPGAYKGYGADHGQRLLWLHYTPDHAADMA